jgi:hypothetical protein
MLSDVSDVPVSVTVTLLIRGHYRGAAGDNGRFGKSDWDSEGPGSGEADSRRNQGHEIEFITHSILLLVINRNSPDEP